MRRQKLSSDEGGGNRASAALGAALSRKSPHGWSKRRLGNSAATLTSPLALLQTTTKIRWGSECIQDLLLK